MARYPGSPHEAGGLHPILRDLYARGVEDGTTPGLMEAVEAVVQIGRDADEEKVRVARNGGARSLDEVPAFDRFGDLAVIGMMVERGFLKIETGD